MQSELVIKENELIEVDSKQGIIFNFDDKMILHVPTEKIFYIITFKTKT